MENPACVKETELSVTSPLWNLREVLNGPSDSVGLFEPGFEYVRPNSEPIKTVKPCVCTLRSRARACVRACDERRGLEGLNAQLG